MSSDKIAHITFNLTPAASAEQRARAYAFKPGGSVRAMTLPTCTDLLGIGAPTRISVCFRQACAASGRARLPEAHEEFRSLAKFEIPIQLDRQGEVSSPSRLCSNNLAATAQKGARSRSHNFDRYHHGRALGNQKSTGEQNTIITDVL